MMKRISAESLKQVIDEANKLVAQDEATEEFAKGLEVAMSNLDYDDLNEIFGRIDKMLAGIDVLSVLTVLVYLMGHGLTKAGPIFLKHFRDEHKADPDLGAAFGMLINGAYRQMTEDALDTSAKDKRK